MQILSSFATMRVDASQAYTHKATLQVFEARADEEQISVLSVEFATTGECDRLFVERMLRGLTEHAKARYGFRFNFRLPLDWADTVTDDDTPAQFEAARKKHHL